MNARIEDIVVDHVGSQGDGVAPGPVFAPLTLPGERVRASVDGDRAEVVELLTPSPDRVAPACRHFGDCGGCSLQHWKAGPYLAWKADLVRLALEREGIEADVAPTAACPPGTRRRLALHARKGRDGVILGFKARRAWRTVDVLECPVADPKLVGAFDALRRAAAPFLEHPKSAPTLHVTLTLSGLDVDVTGVERKGGGLSADARMRAAEAAAAGDFARVTLAGEILYQARSPIVRVGRASVALPPGGFLQATPEAEARMVRLACEAASGARRIADLFCGVGAFTFPLAEIAPVVAADSSPAAVAALKSATASAPGLKAIAAQSRDLFRRPLDRTELKGVDVAVFDPPRAGAQAQAAEIAASSVPVAVGVSCNPVTFARDARILVDGGFRLDSVVPVDQFVWSHHVELVGVFSR